MPVFVRMLGNAGRWLDKAEAYAAAKGFEPAVYMNARLAPDMLPLPKQIQIAADAAKFCVARLSGLDAPAYSDDETTLGELRERLAKTIAFLKSVDPGALDGTDTKEVTVPRRQGPVVMRGDVYLRHFVLANFYFHLTTTYALLRANGVELGKADFLGPAEG